MLLHIVFGCVELLIGFVGGLRFVFGFTVTFSFGFGHLFGCVAWMAAFCLQKKHLAAGVGADLLGSDDLGPSEEHPPFALHGDEL